MDEDYRDDWMGVSSRPGAGKGKYYEGQGDVLRLLSRDRNPAPTHHRPTAHEAPPPEPPITVSELLFIAILVGLAPV